MEESCAYYTRLSDVGVGGLNARMNRDLKYQGNNPIEREFVEYPRYGTNTTATQLTLITVSEAIVPCIGTQSSINLHMIGAAGAEFNSGPRREPHRVGARLGQRSCERVSAHRALGNWPCAELRGMTGGLYVLGSQVLFCWEANWSRYRDM
jgi:hypothetical protein